MKRARPQTPSSSTAKTYQRVGCDRDIVGRILLEWFASDEASFTGGAKIATITVSVNAARTAGDSGYTNAITGRQVSFFLRNKAPKERVRCPTTSGTGLFFIFPPGSSKPTHSVEIDARTKKKLQAMNATLTAKVDEQARQIARMQAEFERRLKEPSRTDRRLELFDAELRYARRQTAPPSVVLSTHKGVMCRDEEACYRLAGEENLPSRGRVCECDAG